MNKEQLIKKAYRVFDSFEKPDQCMRYDDFEDAEFDEMLKNTSRHNLTMAQVGTVAWGPIPCLNPEALGYFMPKLIEFAVSEVVDRDGDPFYCHFICVFYKGPQSNRFKPFTPSHQQMMADVFRFLCQYYSTPIEEEGWLTEAREGISNWEVEEDKTESFASEPLGPV